MFTRNGLVVGGILFCILLPVGYFFLSHQKALNEQREKSLRLHEEVDRLVDEFWSVAKERDDLKKELPEIVKNQGLLGVELHRVLKRIKDPDTTKEQRKLLLEELDGIQARLDNGGVRLDKAEAAAGKIPQRWKKSKKALLKVIDETIDYDSNRMEASSTNVKLGLWTLEELRNGVEAVKW